MIPLNKKQLFLKIAARALVSGLEATPIVGAVIKISYDCWKALKEHQDAIAVQERIEQLEASGALSPDEARQAADAAIAELEEEGQKIPQERADAVRDVISVMPAAIRERTKATLQHARKHGTAAATVLPVTSNFQNADREEFYTGLFPQRRPQFRPGDSVPNYNPDWKLERLIGAGGFGEVWLARNQRMKKQPVAVKFCQDPVHSKLMQREANNLVTLTEKLPLGTPHIVGLLDAHLTNQPYWLMFEYIDGGTLEHRMRLGAMDWATAWQFFEPILQGISQVHEQGIVHRDLKPANILLANGIDPRIADFGIGKVVAEQKAANERASRTFTTMGYGTENYASPEQKEGLPAHPTDDVYSLGIILYQMLSGRMKSLRYPAELKSLPVPETITKIIYDCVYFPREKRIPNAKALLQQFRGEVEIIPPPIITWPQYTTESSKHSTTLQIDELDEEISSMLAEADQVIAEQQQREAQLEKYKAQQRAKEQQEAQKSSRNLIKANEDFALQQQQSIEATIHQARLEAKEEARLKRLESQQEHTNNESESPTNINWPLEALRKYAVFEGRARRKEYWMFILFIFIVTALFMSVDILIGTVNEKTKIGLISGIFSVAMAIPTLAVIVRRLHDTDRSGWWVFTTPIPFLNLALVWFLIQDSTPGRNQFGDNPKVSQGISYTNKYDLEEKRNKVSKTLLIVVGIPYILIMLAAFKGNPVVFYIMFLPIIGFFVKPIIDQLLDKMIK